MNKTCSALLLALVLWLSIIHASCRKKDHSKEPAATEEAGSGVAQPVSLQPFAEFPEEIIGCSCVFSADSVAYEQEQFLYADDMEKIAYVNINGTLTRLLVTERHFSEPQLSIRAANETYRLALEANQLREYGEVTYLKGTLTLTDQSGTLVQLPVFGMCGC
ncbi:MAG: hypothetical protein RMK52_10115 [Chitinophagales bacterium]|nr:hypothetical protein [Chitinophagales bacterium]MDW8394581.1 hypothetical protein [Chitinophagales bacterium]